jgi:hypothetical protein
MILAHAEVAKNIRSAAGQASKNEILRIIDL